MDATAGALHGDRRRDRAWGALEALLQAYPEGVASIAALDRLVAYGLHEREAIGLLAQLREQGRIGMRDGRWRLV